MHWVIVELMKFLTKASLKPGYPPLIHEDRHNLLAETEQQS